MAPGLRGWVGCPFSLFAYKSREPISHPQSAHNPRLPDFTFPRGKRYWKCPWGVIVVSLGRNHRREQAPALQKCVPNRRITSDFLRRAGPWSRRREPQVHGKYLPPRGKRKGTTARTYIAAETQIDAQPPGEAKRTPPGKKHRGSMKTQSCCFSRQTFENEFS